MVYSIVYLCKDLLDNVYIDQPCDLLIRRSIDKLFVIRKFPGPFVLQTFEFENSRAQPYFIHTASIYKSKSRDSRFLNAQAKHWLMFRNHMVNLCIVYL